MENAKKGRVFAFHQFGSLASAEICRESTSPSSRSRALPRAQCAWRREVLRMLEKLESAVLPPETPDEEIAEEEFVLRTLNTLGFAVLDSAPMGLDEEAREEEFVSSALNGLGFPVLDPALVSPDEVVKEDEFVSRSLQKLGFPRLGPASMVPGEEVKGAEKFLSRTSNNQMVHSGGRQLEYSSSLDGLAPLKTPSSNRSVTGATARDLTCAWMGLERMRMNPGGHTPEVLAHRTPPPMAQGLSRSQKQELAWLRSSLFQIATVMDSMVEDIYFKDRDGHFTKVNLALATHLGLSDPSQAIGRNELDFLCHEEAERRCRDDEEIVRRGRILVDVEEKWHMPGRSERWLSTTKIPLRDSSGLIVGTFGISRDITEKKRFDAELEQKGFYDPLTQLPNRSMFDKRVERLVTRARLLGPSGPLFAVVWLDLDRFKCINESLGHGAGDELLVRTARRVEACLRPGDVLARVTGDQFTILLDDLLSESDSVRVAERIQNAMSMPLTVGGTEVFTSVSIGIALSSSGYSRHDDMLRDAYTALYRAKAAGRARHEVFDAEMHRRAVDQLQLETDLRRAIERQEWLVYYQPIIDLRTHRLAGFEALARWRHPCRGLVMPDVFIPTAEETGLIRPLGMWVLREACRQMSAWQAQYQYLPPLSVAVNLSSRQISQIDLPSQVRSVLEETGFPAGSLTLEITESTLMQSMQVGAGVLEQLHEMKVRLDIDDFGTGYSSLAYLQSFPVRALKIGHTFIRGMHSGPMESEIVRAIVGLAHNLGMEVTANGVETPQQIESLIALNCGQAQGYYFSRPIPAQEAERLIIELPTAGWGSVHASCLFPDQIDPLKVHRRR